MKMKKNIYLSMILCSVLIFAVTVIASAQFDPMQDQAAMQGGWGHNDGGRGPWGGGQGGQFGGGMGGAQNMADEPGEIITGTVENTAAALEADLDNAARITMSDTENEVEIDQAGTYVITGSASDGSITVKKGTTGVVLVLEDLNLTSTNGAPVSLNKETEVKVIISGTVTLTDAENPADENSTNAEISDAFDGAVIKIKAGAVVYVTGDGTLNLIGQAKNGIKGGDEAGIILDGPAINITAVNDGINANYDLTILSGKVTVSAGDDGIHADRVLTIGTEAGTGPTITIDKSSEGLEGTVINIYSGEITVNAGDDAVNAAFKYDGLTASLNMMGGNITVNSNGDGLDSNGNINLISGSATINVMARGGEGGVDYDGAYYISEDFVMNNTGGVSGPDNMGGGWRK